MRILFPLVLLSALAFGSVGCLFTGDRGEADIVLVEEMSEERFDVLASDVEAVVQLGVNAAEPDAVLAAGLTEVSGALRTLVEDGAVSTIVDAILDNTELDPAITAIIRLAENRIKEYGGFPYIEDEEGVKLTDRSKRLLLAIANGIDNGLEEL